MWHNPSFYRFIYSRLLITIILLVSSGSSIYAQPQPNFVVFILDDWGAEDSSLYGNKVLKTPNIDSLAQKGIHFGNAFLTTSSCSASRASILTSLYPSKTGAPNLHDKLPSDSILISDLLRPEGYYTASAGKLHLGVPVHNHFDWVTDNADPSGAGMWMEALTTRPKNKPFFLWFAAKDPHVPYDALTPDSIYQAEDIPDVSPFMIDSLKSRANIAQYYNEIHRADGNIGKIIQRMKEEGLLENTYIFILSDNGAPFPRGKTSLYDSGIKTPLIIAGPDINPNKQSSIFVSSIDLVPTILDIANIPANEHMQGISFKEALLGDETVIRDHIYAEQYDHGRPINKQAIRTKDYLLLRNNLTEGHHCMLEAKAIREELVRVKKEGQLNEHQRYCFNRTRPSIELYDVNKDPQSLVNIADTKQAQPIIIELQKKMNSHDQ